VYAANIRKMSEERKLRIILDDLHKEAIRRAHNLLNGKPLIEMEKKPDLFLIKKIL